MNFYVIIKRTFDTEEEIVIENGRIDDEEAAYVINPYDEYAIEEAIQQREQHGGEVTVVTVGEEAAEKELRTALAMGCDRAVLIDSEDVASKDPYTTSTILATFFADQDCDLILGGNVAVDNSSGQVGPRLAELLNISHVATITKMDITGTSVTIARDVEGDEEVIETSLPLLVTTQQGLNDPRYPSLPGIMKAKKKPLQTLELDDLDIDEDDVMAKTETIERFLPAEKEAGRVLEGDIDEQVKELVHLLKDEAQII